MRYAVVENGIVVNVVVAESPLNENWILGETANIGDLYADGVFIKPAVEEE